MSEPPAVAGGLTRGINHPLPQMVLTKRFAGRAENDLIELAETYSLTRSYRQP
jgi:hypothetical protein